MDTDQVPLLGQRPTSKTVGQVTYVFDLDARALSDSVIEYGLKIYFIRALCSASDHYIKLFTGHGRFGYGLYGLCFASLAYQKVSSTQSMLDYTATSIADTVRQSLGGCGSWREMPVYIEDPVLASRLYLRVKNRSGRPALIIKSLANEVSGWQPTYYLTPDSFPGFHQIAQWMEEQVVYTLEIMPLRDKLLIIINGIQKQLIAAINTDHSWLLDPCEFDRPNDIGVHNILSTQWLDWIRTEILSKAWFESEADDTLYLSSDALPPAAINVTRLGHNAVALASTESESWTVFSNKNNPFIQITREFLPPDELKSRQYWELALATTSQVVYQQKDINDGMLLSQFMFNLKHVSPDMQEQRVDTRSLPKPVKSNLLPASETVTHDSRFKTVGLTVQLQSQPDKHLMHGIVSRAGNAPASSAPTPTPTPTSATSLSSTPTKKKQEPDKKDDKNDDKKKVPEKYSVPNIKLKRCSDCGDKVPLDQLTRKSTTSGKVICRVCLDQNSKVKRNTPGKQHSVDKSVTKKKLDQLSLEEYKKQQETIDSRVRALGIFKKMSMMTESNFPKSIDNVRQLIKKILAADFFECSKFVKKSGAARKVPARKVPVTKPKNIGRFITAAHDLPETSKKEASARTSEAHGNREVRIIAVLDSLHKLLEFYSEILKKHSTNTEKPIQELPSVISVAELIDIVSGYGRMICISLNYVEDNEKKKELLEKMHDMIKLAPLLMNALEMLEQGRARWEPYSYDNQKPELKPESEKAMWDLLKEKYNGRTDRIIIRIKMTGALLQFFKWLALPLINKFSSGESHQEAISVFLKTLPDLLSSTTTINGFYHDIFYFLPATPTSPFSEELKSLFSQYPDFKVRLFKSLQSFVDNIYTKKVSSTKDTMFFEQTVILNFFFNSGFYLSTEEQAYMEKQAKLVKENYELIKDVHVHDQNDFNELHYQTLLSEQRQPESEKYKKKTALTYPDNGCLEAGSDTSSDNEDTQPLTSLQNHQTPWEEHMFNFAKSMKDQNFEQSKFIIGQALAASVTPEQKVSALIEKTLFLVNRFLKLSKDEFMLVKKLLPFQKVIMDLDLQQVRNLLLNSVEIRGSKDNVNPMVAIRISNIKFPNIDEKTKYIKNANALYKGMEEKMLDWSVLISEAVSTSKELMAIPVLENEGFLSLHQEVTKNFSLDQINEAIEILNTLKGVHESIVNTQSKINEFHVTVNEVLGKMDQERAGIAMMQNEEQKFLRQNQKKFKWSVAEYTALKELNEYVENSKHEKYERFLLSGDLYDKLLE
ncbi:hypothetical protein [Endozoicomonas montiporae]|uniref:hypothetical protein n=1 Tax=Endozoicomonas montiporae TaxID=1027273 RepID=UPI0011A18488|nr:hypothetical protein [Endozoicomonas montiporae]